MRSLALGGASAFATVLSLGVEAADLSYPPATAGSYPPVSAPAPQVLVIPGAPAPIPQYQYNGAPAAPPITRPYSEVPPITPPDVVPGTVLPPRAACDPAWRCGNGACGWTPSCAPKPQPELGAYGPPRPQLYSQAGRPPDPYIGPYGSPAPQVYSPAPHPYVGPYASQGSIPYGPQVYSGPADRMRWMVGPQPYGM
jgi:hypothetical protein